MTHHSIQVDKPNSWLRLIAQEIPDELHINHDESTLMRLKAYRFAYTY